MHVYSDLWKSVTSSFWVTKVRYLVVSHDTTPPPPPQEFLGVSLPPPPPPPRDISTSCEPTTFRPSVYILPGNHRIVRRNRSWLRPMFDFEQKERGIWKRDASRSETTREAEHVGKKVNNERSCWGGEHTAKKRSVERKMGKIQRSERGEKKLWMCMPFKNHATNCLTT